jgi:hypothetical protein
MNDDHDDHRLKAALRALAAAVPIDTGPNLTPVSTRSRPRALLPLGSLAGVCLVVAAVVLVVSHLNMPTYPPATASSTAATPGKTAATSQTASPSEALSPRMAHVHEIAGLSVLDFDYPASWQMLASYTRWTNHGPVVYFAVGTGQFDSPCQTVPPTASMGVVITCDKADATVVGDQVVVYGYARGVSLGLPSPGGSVDASLPWTTVAGEPALEYHFDDSCFWYVTEEGSWDGGWEIWGKWGPGAHDTEAQVEALVASLTLTRQGPSPT